MKLDADNRTHWSRRAQSIGLVTLITAVIWLYAEGQDVRDLTREVRLSLPARIGDATVVQFAGDTPGQVQLQLMGASSSLSQFEQALGAGGSLRLPIEPADLAGPSPVALDLPAMIGRARLREDQPAGPTLEDLGISVISVEPARVRVNVDELVNRELRVLFDPGTVEVQSNWTAEPAQVEATLLRSRLDAVEGAADALYVEAVVPRETLADLPEGVRQENFQADLRLPEVLIPAGPMADYTRLRRQTVSLSFTVERQRASVRLSKPVPVWLISSPSELQRYRVDLASEDRVLNDVRVEGPRDLIDQLKAEGSELRVIARFDLTSEELDRGVTASTLTAIEIQEVVDGRRRVRAVVPLNPRALQPGITPTPPTFVSAMPDVRVTVPDPVVRFEVTRREQ